MKWGAKVINGSGKKLIDWEKEKLAVELAKLPKTNLQNISEEETISVSAEELAKIESKKANLISQIATETTELAEIIKSVQEKLSEDFQDIFEKLFEAQTKIVQSQFGQLNFANGQLDIIKWTLTKKISEEELQIILDKKTKLIEGEEELKKLNEQLGSKQQEVTGMQEEIVEPEKRAKLQKFEEKKKPQATLSQEQFGNFLQNLLNKRDQSSSASSSKMKNEVKKEENQESENKELKEEIQAQTQAVEIKPYNIDWNKLLEKK